MKFHLATKLPQAIQGLNGAHEYLRAGTKPLGSHSEIKKTAMAFRVAEDEVLAVLETQADASLYERRT
jgi:hypothetical protein